MSSAPVPIAPTINVLHVCEPTYAGAAAVAYELARGLRPKGIEPLMCTPPGELARWCQAEQVPVVDLPFSRRSPASYISAIRRVRELVATGGFELIHSHSSFSGLLVRLAWQPGWPPIIYQPHAWSFLAVRSRLRPLVVWLERALAPRTALCICVSDYELQLSQAVGLHYRRAEVIPNGVDFAALKADHAVQTRPAVAGCVTRLASQKAIDVLLRAAADEWWPPGMRLELVGDGPDREELEALSRQLGLNEAVDFLGYHPDVEAKLRGWAVLVLPSRYEAGVPLTLLEAIALEVPVVTTAVADVERLSADGLAVVPVGDAAALARAVAAVAGDPAVAAARAAQLRAAAQMRYSLAAQLERMAAIYSELSRG